MSSERRTIARRITNRQSAEQVRVRQLLRCLDIPRMLIICTYDNPIPRELHDHVSHPMTLSHIPHYVHS